MSEQPRLLTVEECYKLESVNALVEQIELRYKLINEMVGTLYPGIVFDQIGKIREHLRSVEYAKRT